MHVVFIKQPHVGEDGCFGAAVTEFRAQLHREAGDAGAQPAIAASAAPKDPSAMDRPELIELARKRNLEGYESMTKAELVEALS